MRLFFVHLLKSIRLRPLQPVILILTVALSVAFTASSLSLGRAISWENADRNSMLYGTSDVTVTQSSSAQARFMLAERAEELLSGSGVAVGALDLILGAEGDTEVYAAAADFLEIGKVFPLSFSEHLVVTDDTLRESVFVTRELSERLGVSLGDTLTLSIFGLDRAYRVTGISETPLVGGKEALLDIRGVLSALSYHSSLIAALGEDFLPYTTIFIDLNDGVEPSDAIALLRSGADFSDKSFTDLTDVLDGSLVTVTLGFVIGASIAAVSLVAAAVTFSCFYILSLKRREENEAFASVGARPLFLNLMQYAEALIYLLVGAPIGLLLSLPMSLMLDSLVGFEYSRSALTPYSGAVAILVAAVSVVLTVTAFVATRDRGSRKAKKAGLLLPLLFIVVTGLIITPLLSGAARLISAIISIATILILLLLWAPPVFSVISRAFADRAERGRKSASLSYALKNSASVRVLHSSARLVALLVVSLAVTTAMILSSLGFSRLHEIALSGDYAVVNPTERLYARLSDDYRHSVFKVYQQTGAFENGQTVAVFAADSPLAFGEDMDIRKLPQGDEAVISSASARMLSVEEGDVIGVKVEGRRLELTVSGIASSGLPLIIMDCEHQGIAYNLLLADAQEGDQAQLLDGLSAAAASEMSLVVGVDELLGQSSRLIDIYVVAGCVIAAALLMFALIGLSDNLYESYKHRRTDFELYLLAGASPADIRRMKLVEVLHTLALGTLGGLLIALPVLLLFNAAGYSLNFEIFLCIKKYFS